MIDFFYVTRISGDKVLINPKYIISIDKNGKCGSNDQYRITMSGGYNVYTLMTIVEILDAWNRVED